MRCSSDAKLTDSTHLAGEIRFVYWLPPEDFENARSELVELGYSFREAFLTPCQVLRASGDSLVFASPAKWNGMCNRQGSWYRASVRAGQYMLVADHRLPARFDSLLDVTIAESDFTPTELPVREELQSLIASDEYESAKPDGWENVSWSDSFFMRVLFRIKRFWGRGESMKQHWLGHRGNHANFLSKRYTTRIDGEDVPYSVTDNASVCSSCAEFFNVVEPGSRKLVRACPGSITFADAKPEVYYDVRPVSLSVEQRELA